MYQQEQQLYQHLSLPDRSLHFNLQNEIATFRSISPDQAFAAAEKQLITYLCEHVLQIEHPYHTKDKDNLPHTRKYFDCHTAAGRQLLPDNYDGQTDFVRLCSNPYYVNKLNLEKESAGNPYYQPEAKELRRLERSWAEMQGAPIFVEKVFNSADNTMLVWASPPGNPEDGYWNSSIVYVYQIKLAQNGQRELLCWSCITKLSLARHRDLLRFLSPQSDIPDQTTPEDIVLSPISLSPLDQLKYQISSPQDLINLIYNFSGKSLDPEQIRKDLQKIDRLRQVLKPQIQQAARLLKAGNETEMDKLIDEIEQKAMETFYTPEELIAQLAAGLQRADNHDSLSINNQLSVQIPDQNQLARLNSASRRILAGSLITNHQSLITLVWSLRREQMSASGTSCPSTMLNSSADNIIQAEQRLSGEHECPVCGATFSGSKCPYCPYEVE